MKKEFLSALAVGVAMTSVAFAGDAFDQGDKALSQGKKPLLLRVDKEGNQSLFKADAVTVEELAKLKGLEDSSKAKEAFMAKTIETVATAANSLDSKSRIAESDQVKSTAANYGYYYGNYYYGPYYYNPYQYSYYSYYNSYYRPVQIYYQPNYYTNYNYQYQWGYYTGGYNYYWYYY